MRQFKINQFYVLAFLDGSTDQIKILAYRLHNRRPVKPDLETRAQNPAPASGCGSSLGRGKTSTVGLENPYHFLRPAPPVARGNLTLSSCRGYGTMGPSHQPSFTKPTYNERSTAGSSRRDDYGGNERLGKPESNQHFMSYRPQQAGSNFWQPPSGVNYGASEGWRSNNNPLGAVPGESRQQNYQGRRKSELNPHCMSYTPHPEGANFCPPRSGASEGWRPNINNQSRAAPGEGQQKNYEGVRKSESNPHSMSYRPQQAGSHFGQPRSGVTNGASEGWRLNINKQSRAASGESRQKNYDGLRKSESNPHSMSNRSQQAGSNYWQPLSGASEDWMSSNNPSGAAPGDSWQKNYVESSGQRQQPNRSFSGNTGRGRGRGCYHGN